MKNSQIIDSWSKIEPDGTADARMLDTILARNRWAQSEKRKGFAAKRPGRKRLAPVAACLVMLIAATAVFGSNAGWLGGKAYTEELSGGTLCFYKTDGTSVGSIDFGINVTGRALTPEENGILFGDLGVASHGLFDSTDKTLLHVEGKTGNTRVILAAPGLPTADWKHNGVEKTSEINGVKVSAGYFVTKENSRGIKNIIYYASLALSDVSMYVECGGNFDERDAWQSEIACVIDKLIQNGAPDIWEIMK